MLTRVRCLIRLHRWQPERVDDGGRYKQCGDCSKWKRIKIGDGTHYNPGDPYRPGGGTG